MSRVNYNTKDTSDLTGSENANLSGKVEGTSYTPNRSGLESIIGRGKKAVSGALLPLAFAGYMGLTGCFNDVVNPVRVADQIQDKTYEGPATQMGDIKAGTQEHRLSATEFVVEENSGEHSQIADLGEGNVKYSLQGDARDDFYIKDGKLYMKENPDFEKQQMYNVAIKAKDLNTGEVETLKYIVHVNDVLEAQDTKITNDVVKENSEPGTYVGTFFNDAKEKGTTYTLIGDESNENFFLQDGKELYTLSENFNFENEKQRVHNVVVGQVNTKTGNIKNVQGIDIHTNDVNERPTGVVFVPSKGFGGGAPKGSILGIFDKVIDEDIGDSHSIEVRGEEAKKKFKVVNDELVANKWVKKGKHTVPIEVEDRQGLKLKKNIEFWVK